MIRTSRRSALKSLATVPIVGAVAHWFKVDLGAHKVEETPEFKHRMAGVYVLRMVNTLQLRYKKVRGQYAPLALLKSHSPRDSWLDSERAITARLSRKQFDQMRFEDAEIVPGWLCQFSLSVDRHYAAPPSHHCE